MGGARREATHDIPRGGASDDDRGVAGRGSGGDCYPDCNADGALTIQDFGCFQTRFVGGDLYADCDADGRLTAPDFACFQTKFVAGCP